MITVPLTSEVLCCHLAGTRDVRNQRLCRNSSHLVVSYECMSIFCIGPATNNVFSIIKTINGTSDIWLNKPQTVWFCGCGENDINCGWNLPYLGVVTWVQVVWFDWPWSWADKLCHPQRTPSAALTGPVCPTLKGYCWLSRPPNTENLNECMHCKQVECCWPDVDCAESWQRFVLTGHGQCCCLRGRFFKPFHKISNLHFHKIKCSRSWTTKRVL